MSDEKKTWMRKYLECRNQNQTVVDAEDGVTKDRYSMEPHHPFGRQGYYIMVFCWIKRSLHEHIHANARWARDVGWLAPAYQGQPQAHDYLMPWWPGSLINEDLLP